MITALADAADVGVNLLDLDELAHRMIKDRGAESCYIDYHPSFGASPFGKVLCTSVNDAVLHGLPHDYALQSTATCSASTSRRRRRLGVRLGVLPRRRHAAPGGPRADRDHRRARSPRASTRPGSATGSATSRTPSARWPARPASASTSSSAGTASAGPCTATRTSPTTARRGRGLKLKAGLVIAIEPWFLHTTDEIYTDADGWTLRSADGSRGAHMEHTVAITDGGPHRADRPRRRLVRRT